jgi:N utilization substance protein B
MASNRHLGRIVALQCLYELDFRSELGDHADVDELLSRNLVQYQSQIDDKKFVKQIVEGVQELRDKLDAILIPLAPTGRLIKSQQLIVQFLESVYGNLPIVKRPLQR